MSEQYRNAFQTLVDRAPAPPTWEQVSVPTPRPARTRGPLIAAGTGVAVLALVGVVAWLIPVGGGLAPAAAAIDHVQVRFTQQVTLVCEGGTISDNGGFDEAAIDIYGPSSDDRWRADVTFPDGSVQSFLYEGGPADSRRSWQRPAPAPPDFGMVFHQAGCSYPTPGGSSTWTLVGPPVQAYRIPSEFVTTARVDPRSGSETDLLDDLATREGLVVSRSDTWRGVPVTVHVWDRSFTDDVGRRVTASTEWWIDVAARRVERTVDVGEHEGLGSWSTELAVASRDRVTVPSEFFAPDDMTLVLDLTGGEFGDGAEVPTTTSIPPLSEPLMDGAVPVEEGDLPTADLAAVADVREGDRLFRVRAPEGRALFVRLRPGARPLLFGTSCDVLTDVLTSVELPAGWDGLCTERTDQGERHNGVFTYTEGVSP